MKLSIVMPVYNERNTIKEILRRVRQVDLGDLEREIVIVDDGSEDGTRDILAMEEDSGTRVIYHTENCGKGAAVRTGFKAAAGDLILIQDADLEYDPEDYPNLIEPVLKGKAQVVYGSRFTGPRKNMLFWHFVGNRFLALVTNILYNTTLSDMETCYKLFTRESLEGIELRSNHFDIEPEITAKILKKRIRIFEVPISYAGREMEEGKKITWRDGLPALWTLIKYRFIN
jgi:glycosyltransferase involved in cell wall biosynthesis